MREYTALYNLQHVIFGTVLENQETDMCRFWQNTVWTIKQRTAVF